jgi:SSS family solute:Na+ symporter
MQNVLQLMLYSYAFMVSGLFIPVIGAFFWKRSNSTAALWSMLLGGGTTITLIASGINLPLGLDANIYGISISAATFILISFLTSTEEINSSIELSEEAD